MPQVTVTDSVVTIAMKGLKHDNDNQQQNRTTFS